MNNRALGFVALLAVVGVSIVFGMVLGGKLNAPDVALAAPATAPLQLAPAATVLPAAVTDFADIAEGAMPAVVGVRSMELDDDEEEDADEDSMSREEMFFQWFFGPESRPRDRMRSEPRIGEGSGFIISDDGYVMTNNHVVDGADRIIVSLQTGQEFDAEIIGTDPSIDLALLKMDPGKTQLPSLPLGDSSHLRVGQWVIAIGNPFDYEHTVTVGVVSAKERRVPIGSTDIGVVSFIQTDAAINFGNSGGPLLDSSGNVIGINTAIRRDGWAEGIGFALPINQARSVMQQLRTRGYVQRGFIGITMNSLPIDEETRDAYRLPDTNGVLVYKVKGDGPADRAGIRKGDVFRSVDGESVRNNSDLIGKIAAHQPGDKVDIEVFRKGKTLELQATLVERDEEALRPTVDEPTARPRDEPVEESTGLGMTVENLSPEMRDRLRLPDNQFGVRVVDIEYDSEAADKGISRNMVIAAIDDRELHNVSDWNKALAGLKPGETLRLEVLEGTRGFLVFLRAR